MKYIFYHTHSCGGRTLIKCIRSHMNICEWRKLESWLYENNVMYSMYYDDYNFFEIHRMGIWDKTFKFHFHDCFDFFIKNNFNTFKKITTIRDPADYIIKQFNRQTIQNKFDISDIFDEYPKYKRYLSIFYTLPLIYINKKQFDYIIDITNIKKVLNEINIDIKEVPKITDNKNITIIKNDNICDILKNEKSILNYYKIIDMYNELKEEYEL